MALEAVQCPHCGAPISGEGGQEEKRCDYCGTGLRFAQASPEARRPDQRRRFISERELAKLYSTATLAFCDQDWAEAKRLLTRVAAIDPDYGDEGWTARELLAVVAQELMWR
jgi:primosomal protein N'